MTRWTIFAGFAVCTLLAAPAAMAKPAFPSWVPNGSEFGCNTCHDSAAPPVTWNAFGEDVLATMAADSPNWGAVCRLDSDGDGATNGAELGDPDCEWVFDEPAPDGDVFNPSDPDSTPPAEDPEDAGGVTDTADVSGEGGSGEVAGGDGGGGDGGGGDGGGCAGGSSAPVAGLAMLLGLALVGRRRVC
jgi:hypothetical protein